MVRAVLSRWWLHDPQLHQRPSVPGYAMLGLVGVSLLCSRLCLRCCRDGGSGRRSFSLPSSAAEHASLFDSGVVGNKTSVAFEISDKPGSLEEVLRLFWKHDINMSRIQSKPPKFADSSCAFHIDFDGVPGDANVKAMLEALGQACSNLVIMDPARGTPWGCCVRCLYGQLAMC